MESGHYFLLEVDPLRDGVVQLSFWEINEHTSYLGSSLFSYQLLDMFVDCVSHNLFLLLSLGSFKLS